jgi:hypothetical protein
MNAVRIILISVLALSSLLACDKNGSNSGNPNRSPVGTVGNVAQAMGTVTGTYNLLDEVRSFTTTNTFDGAQIKSIETYSGVQFYGSARFEQTNSTYKNMIPSTSYINLRLTFTNISNQRQSIDIGIAGGSGAVSYGFGTASANLIFEDQYGTVQLNGYFDNNYYTGTLYYTNKQTNTQGSLGQFRVQTCGFFTCVQ